MSGRERKFDVVIVGAGPAGISAAVWCRDLGLSAVVIEKNAEPGGQLLRIHNPVLNYLGLAAANGREMRDRFLETVDRYGIEILTSTAASAIGENGTSVTTAAGDVFTSQFVILATGVRRRSLGIPGETEFVGRGVLESGSLERGSAKGKTVAIVGGGDAALENALILSEHAEKVYVIHRRDRFSARDEFRRRAAHLPTVEFITNSTVSRVNGGAAVESVDVFDHCTGAARTIPVDLVLFRIGVQPNSELAGGWVPTTSAGYIPTDPYGQTERGRIFAIGDLANPSAPTIATAVGGGAAAAKRLRVLSADLHSFQ